MLDVIVAGEIFVDWIMSGLDAWPEPGKEVFASHFARDIGGGTSITACALARLGLRSGVMAAIGTDTGEWIVNRLRAFGVETNELVLDTTEPSAFTVIASRPEDRAFLTYPGANKSFPEHFATRLQSGKPLARHIHLAFPLSPESAPAVIGRIRELGSSVSLDVGWREAWLSDKRSFEVLRSIDIFFPNEVEAARMTGERQTTGILRKFAAAGARKVALKLGAEGAALLWDDAIHFAAPYRVTPVDSTGAGDCFDAGFLHSWLAGIDPQTCLQRANICGALSTQSYGGITSAPDLEQLQRVLEKVHI